MKKMLVVVVALAFAAGSLGFWFTRGGSSKSHFQSMNVERGDLVATISATGPLEPEVVVDIGAQVTGRIMELGKDPKDPTKDIDYNTPVDKGTILARIDPTIYQFQVVQAEAQLAQAKANVEKAAADLIKLRAQQIQTDRDWRRALDLGPTKANAISGLDFDMARATADTASSALKVGHATLLTNQKIVDQAEAALKLAQTNLNYCTITSPEKGMIIDRRVNLGQTVNSNMAAPSLFLIAKDLKRMQLWISVNEADIGQIHEAVTFTGTTTYGSPTISKVVDMSGLSVGKALAGPGIPPGTTIAAVDADSLTLSQPATEAATGVTLTASQIARFTVDTFPNEAFEGRVLKIRLNATMTQNVVTYTVEVEYDNTDMKLKPYLTANVRFQVDERKNVLLVPNAALRFRPQFNQIHPDAREEYSRSLKRRAAHMDRGGEEGANPAAPPQPAARTEQQKRDAAGKVKPKKRDEKATVWIEDNGYVRPKRVRIGLSDTVMTEVLGDDLPEGAQVVVRESKAQESDSGDNPFMTKNPFGGAPKKKE